MDKKAWDEYINKAEKKLKITPEKKKGFWSVVGTLFIEAFKIYATGQMKRK